MAGQIMDEKQANLLPDNLEKILFLRENIVISNLSLDWLRLNKLFITGNNYFIVYNFIFCVKHMARVCQEPDYPVRTGTLTRLSGQNRNPNWNSGSVYTGTRLVFKKSSSVQTGTGLSFKKSGPVVPELEHPFENLVPVPFW